MNWPAVQSVLRGPTSLIYLVSFLMNNIYIAAYLNDHIIRLLDLAIRTLVGEPFLGHTELLILVSFSSNSTLIVSYLKDKTI